MRLIVLSFGVQVREFRCSSFSVQVGWFWVSVLRLRPGRLARGSPSHSPCRCSGTALQTVLCIGERERERERKRERERESEIELEREA